jgi:hypothetical protein
MLGKAVNVVVLVITMAETLLEAQEEKVGMMAVVVTATVLGTTPVVVVAVHVPKSTTLSMNTITCLKQRFVVAKKVVEMILLAGMRTVEEVGEEVAVVGHLQLF